MCGIVAITARPDSGATIDVDALRRSLGAARDTIRLAADPDRLEDAARFLADVNQTLIGLGGVVALVSDPLLASELAAVVDDIGSVLDDLQRSLDGPNGPSDADLEAANRAIGAVRDECWAIRRDRLRTAAAVAALSGAGAGRSAIAGYLSIQLALSAIDRLEVRGRDSAGIHVLVWDHGLELAPGGVSLLGARGADPLFVGGSVRVDGPCLAFVYKAAAEIGELGDNTASLRAQIASDALLRQALASPAARCTVLAHTRWASVGIISEPNAHPLNSEESLGAEMVSRGPYVAAALNGDVDNHADLRAIEHLQVPAEITTDAKVIPTLVSRVAGGGVELTEAFRRTVARFEGSVAIGAVSSAEPSKVWLALRGSGQALYVGWTDELVIAASEPYGLVELTRRYVRMDGETPANPDAPATSRGQVIVMDGDCAGDVASIERLAYDGTTLALSDADVVTAEVTTRDIDRGSFPHFLLKEISEAPTSFRNTLRGRVGTSADGQLFARVGDQTIPPWVADQLAAGTIRRVVILGQGTAAVAGAAMARILQGLIGRCHLLVESTTATEFSGFGLTADMSDTLVIAVSQSGTTTDTNRTVDLARSRGAAVIGVVNRRGSDLCDKADGVMYTSDGRDVEMSVASTKAFYAQVAAGGLLACALSAAAGVGDDRTRHDLLDGLRAMPDAMAVVLSRRSDIARAAFEFAPSRRYWALVGNGPNHIAAREVRIKLSELCYKSMACDVTEDKKHIDLSSEPLILVCAAGLSGSTADDVAKEVAIYRAHKAAAVVIATEGEERFAAAHHVIAVPAVAPGLAFVLSAMVGHLFGYEAALAIDAQARSLREVRAAVEECLDGLPDGDTVMERLVSPMAAAASRFFDQLRSGAFNGHLEAGTAVRLASVLRFASQMVPLEAYQTEHGKVGTPQVLVDDLLAALTAAIDELTRPIDAIKHQAKTVTVGISRSDEGLLGNWLVQATLDAGAPRDRLSYRNLKTLADLAPAIDSVLGSVRYRIDDAPDGEGTITVIDRAGIGRDLVSRTDRDHRLRGTKHRVAAERELWAAKGRADGRTILLVPEVKGVQTTGITLLHVRFADRLGPEVARSVLSGYRSRYDQLTDVVTETEPVFRDDLLASVSVTDLLTLPVQVLAEHWRSSGQ